MIGCPEGWFHDWEFVKHETLTVRSPMGNCRWVEAVNTVCLKCGKVDNEIESQKQYYASRENRAKELIKKRGMK